jgi:hypothetical protein
MWTWIWQCHVNLFKFIVKATMQKSDVDDDDNSLTTINCGSAQKIFFSLSLALYYQDFHQYQRTNEWKEKFKKCLKQLNERRKKKWNEMEINYFWKGSAKNRKGFKIVYWYFQLKLQSIESDSERNVNDGWWIDETNERG